MAAEAECKISGYQLFETVPSSAENLTIDQDAVRIVQQYNSIVPILIYGEPSKGNDSLAQDLSRSHIF